MNAELSKLGRYWHRIEIDADNIYFVDLTRLVYVSIDKKGADYELCLKFDSGDDIEIDAPTLEAAVALAEAMQLD